MTDQSAKQNKDAILFASKASQLIQVRKFEEALNLCETGVRIFPFYSPGHYILGLCYEALGKHEDAKNEFERTLVYDPSHNKAMRKLSEFYRQSGLDQLANELLVKEALYSPLDPEIINILKDNDLYNQLNPEIDIQAEDVAESIPDIQIENELASEDEGIQSIEEIEDTEEAESQTPELATIAGEEQADETENTFAEDESAPIDNLDPLAESDDEMIIDNARSDAYDDDFADKNHDINDSDDFSPLMQGYLSKEEDEDDEDQWMEVENLLDNEEEMSEADVDPVPEGPKGETDMLLEQLSSDEDDDIDLEAGVIDPYDHIDLTSEVDRNKIAADELSGDDLTAGVADPLEKKEEIKK